MTNISLQEKKIYQKQEQEYNKGAKFFSATRKNFWSDLEFIKKYYTPKSKILDFGCGNGRLIDFLAIQSTNYLGLDTSSALIDLAKKNHPSFQFKKISFHFQESKTIKPKFDLIFSIAVFHHFPKGKIREHIFTNLKNLLKKDGLLLLTVWNLNQKKYLKKLQNKKQGWLPFLNGQKKEIFKRFVYRWEIKELRELCQKNNLSVVKTGMTSRNKKMVNLYILSQKYHKKKQDY